MLDVHSLRVRDSLGEPIVFKGFAQACKWTEWNQVSDLDNER